MNTFKEYIEQKKLDSEKFKYLFPTYSSVFDVEISALNTYLVDTEMMDIIKKGMEKYLNHNLDNGEFFGMFGIIIKIISYEISEELYHENPEIREENVEMLAHKFRKKMVKKMCSLFALDEKRYSSLVGL